MAERIILAGASGLIGTQLRTLLARRGSEIVQLVRRPPEGPGAVFWDPGAGIIDHGTLAGADALISLGGASVGRLPWTAAYRTQLRNSRLSVTNTLAGAITELGDDAPKTWLSASAVGYYGSRPGHTLTEDSGAGDTFLARLCVDWEAATGPAEAHTRVVHLRTAPVIHPLGVLKPMIRLARLGLSGPLGSGRQHWPWISLTDEARGILHALDVGLTGPVNLTGPHIATQAEVGRFLSRQLRRPFLVPAPEWGLNLALGRDATESLLTADAAVVPEALLHSGFEFTHATPQAAIQSALGATR